MSLVTNTFYFTNTNTNSKVFLLIKLTEEVLCYKKYIFFTIICPLISTHISIKVIAYTIVGLALDFVHSRASFAVIEQFYTVNLSWKLPVRMLPFWVNLVQIMTKLYVKFMTLDPKSLMDRAKTENIHFNSLFLLPHL